MDRISSISRRGGFGSIGFVLSFYLQGCGAEVEDEPDFESSGLKIVYKLRFMGIVNVLRRLQFQDHAVIHDHIGNKVADLFSFVVNGDAVIFNRFDSRFF